MTDKQLLKRLQYQQNRLLNIKNYSFYLSSNNHKYIGVYFNIWIHDGNKNQEIVFTNTFDVRDASLTIKLIKLRDFIDDLLNNSIDEINKI